MKITKKQLVTLIGESTYKEMKSLKEAFDDDSDEFRGQKSIFGRRAVTPRMKHQKGSAVPQAGKEKVSINHQKIYANPQTGELDYGKIKGRPAEWEHVGWRLFGENDVFFIGDKQTIQEFLKKYNIELKKIFERANLPSMENIRYTTRKLRPTEPRFRDPNAEGGYKKKGFWTEPVSGKGPGYDIKGTFKPEGGGLLSQKELAKGLRTSLNPWKLGERTKRSGFMDIVRQEIELDDTLQEKMVRAGLPLFVLSDSDSLSARDYLNRYSYNDDLKEIEYTTHAFNYYKDTAEWNRLHKKRKQKDVDLNDLKKDSLNLARQFNSTYENYPETQGTLDSGEKKITPVYLLNAKGILQDKMDIMVESILSIKGVLSESQSSKDTYTWTVSFVVKFGRRLEKEIGELATKYDFVTSVSVKTPKITPEYLESLKEDGGTGTIMDIKEIVQGLAKVLEDTKQRLMRIKGISILKPKKELKIKRPNINPQLNEHNIGKIIDGILGEIDKL